MVAKQVVGKQGLPVSQHVLSLPYLSSLLLSQWNAANGTWVTSPSHQAVEKRIGNNYKNVSKWNARTAIN